MSYLMQYALRRPPSARAPKGPRPRVDERMLLNHPGFYGGAYVRTYVEDTSGRLPERRRRLRGASTWPPSPHVTLEITDCSNAINLEFALTSAGDRENALFKVDTLLGALGRFREALGAEAALYADRERDHLRR
jgi:hypothetical protein